MTPRTKRLLEQYYRVLGWQPFGLLFAIALAFALVLDQLGTDYLAAAEERQQLALDAQTIDAKLELKGKVADKLRESSAQLAVLGEGSYSGMEVGFAEQALLTYAQGLVGQSLNGRLDSVVAGPRAPRAPLTLIGARLTFSGTTTGLIQLLETARQGVPYLHAAALEIKVDQPEQPGKLGADILMQAIYLPEQYAKSTETAKVAATKHAGR